MIQPEVVELNSSDSEDSDDLVVISEEEIKTPNPTINKCFPDDNLTYSDDFIEFLDLCMRLEDNKYMRNIIKILILPHYRNADENYIKSKAFNKMLDLNINHMQSRGIVNFTWIKKIINNLKANKKIISKIEDVITIDEDKIQNSNSILVKNPFAKSKITEQLNPSEKKSQSNCKANLTKKQHEVIEIDSDIELNKTNNTNICKTYLTENNSKTNKNTKKGKRRKKRIKGKKTKDFTKLDKTEETENAESEISKTNSIDFVTSIDNNNHSLLSETSHSVNVPLVPLLNVTPVLNDEVFEIPVISNETKRLNEVTLEGPSKRICTEENRTNRSEQSLLENSEIDETESKIAIIEWNIAKLKDLIQELEESEVNLDANCSTYILAHQYKTKLLNLYEDLCKLTETPCVERRLKIRLEVPDGHPPGPARRLEAWFNRPLKKGEVAFPDFMDVVVCVATANNEDLLGWSYKEVLVEARNLFKVCGMQLQKHRQKQEWKHIQELIDDSPDPAEFDPELEAKLQRNRLIGEKRENEIIESFTKAQEDKSNQRKRIEPRNLNNVPNIVNAHENFITQSVLEKTREIKNADISLTTINQTDIIKENASENVKTVFVSEQTNETSNANIFNITTDIKREYASENIITDSVETDIKIKEENICTNYDAYTDESEDSDIELIEESIVIVKDENETLHIKKEIEDNDYIQIDGIKKEIKTEFKCEQELSEQDVLSILSEIEQKSKNGLDIETRIIYDEPSVTIVFDSSDTSDAED